MRKTEINFTVLPVIEVDELEHGDAHRFCYDPDCPCKRDQNLIDTVNRQYRAGLITESEGTRIVQGKVI